MGQKICISLLLFLGVLHGAWGGDRSAAFRAERPTPHPAELAPEVQTEGFTCGMHALNSIYTSYGLDPEIFRLRSRLGVDVPTIPIGTDTKGTVQPDIIRVLSQDGFESKLLRLKTQEEKVLLTKHLEESHPAMTLIKRKENGNLHWVVITGLVKDQLTIADSLYPEKVYNEPYEPFASENIINVILIRPNKANSVRRTLWGSHGLGLLGVLSSAGSFLKILCIFSGLILLHALALKLAALRTLQGFKFVRSLGLVCSSFGVWVIVALLVDGSFGYAPLLISLLGPVVYIWVFQRALNLSLGLTIKLFVVSLLLLGAFIIMAVMLSGIVQMV